MAERDKRKRKRKRKKTALKRTTDRDLEDETKFALLAPWAKWTVTGNALGVIAIVAVVGLVILAYMVIAVARDALAQAPG